jgi:hypothetical protein
MIWVLYPYSEGSQVSLASVNFSGAISQIYEDVAHEDLALESPSLA